jgi:lipopolysaccharide transport system permease protein
MPLLLQLWMFATPVVYPLSAVPHRFRPLYDLNPLVGIVESFRQVLLMGVPPGFGTLGIAALIAIGGVPLAYGLFKYVDASMADII